MRVLIVDDSALFRFFLRELLQNDSRFEIVGEESNGQKAVEVTKSLKPDIIIMDIQMPVMDGITASELIMSKVPTPILIFSSAINRESSFKAYQAGVIDVIQKPEIDRFNDTTYTEEFYEKLFLIGSKKRSDKKVEERTPVTVEKSELKYKPEVVVIGASTGGPIAIRTILADLPKEFQIPIVIVQHLERGCEETFKTWLSKSSSLDFVVVDTTKKLIAGLVYIAPTDRHIILKDGFVKPSDTEKVLNQRPSVDVLFNSASNEYGCKTLGILLTGMGRDGADGCKSIINKGGKTVVQDRESSVIYGMPKVAIESNSASIISPLNRISTILLEM